MFHKLAQIGANACLRRRWISLSQLDWCVYALEKWINSLSTFFFFLVLSVLTKKFVQLFVFLSTFLSIRRRLGGWHAKSAWSCQITGILLMLSVTYLIGPQLEILDIQFLFLMDILVLSICFIVSPVYPPQLNFSYSVVKHNKQKKNFTLLVITVIHVLSLFLSTHIVMLYSMLGLFVSIVALVPTQRSQQKTYNSP